MKLIDKDALVAEIERLEKKNNESENVYDFGTERALKSILSFINTLEVKEVDLIKEAERFVQTKEFIESTESPVIVTAKHFFELGLKAQKGEEV